MEELGDIDEPSSHSKRRALLVEALASPDSDTRHSAATGLARLADPTASGDMAATLDREQNDLIKSEMQDALDACRSVATTV